MSERISAAKIWQIFCVLFLIWTAIVGVVWLLGYDFTAEYVQRRVINMDLSIGEGTRRSVQFCGAVRTFLPGNLDESVPCLVWNLLPFYLIPGFVLGVALKKTFWRF